MMCPPLIQCLNIHLVAPILIFHSQFFPIFFLKLTSFQNTFLPSKSSLNLQPNLKSFASLCTTMTTAFTLLIFSIKYITNYSNLVCNHCSKIILHFFSTFLYFSFPLSLAFLFSHTLRDHIIHSFS